jgi:RHS repeat-associated protein
VTDYQGNEYECIEYTPYGESWIEKTQDGLELLPYKFTGKELDSETGLYYYGARYLSPKTGRWLSADPALGDYLPLAPVDEEARNYNGELPGMGGVFNMMNLALYHYAGNNPVKYTDPDGKSPAVAAVALTMPWSEIALGVGLGISVSGATLASAMALPLLITSDSVARRRQSDGNLYHATTSSDFTDALGVIGIKAINPLMLNSGSRFGKALYVAEDPNTAIIENGAPALTVLKFSMNKLARILDLTNPAITKEMGYNSGMSHERTQQLMQSWDLKGVDAIRFPSEKNPGGVNYAVLNWSKLNFEGIYDGQ